IPESADPLDNTWVHPENYGVARIIRQSMGAPASGSGTTTGSLGSAEFTLLKEKYGVGDTTINDIVDELKKPNRDPREGYPKPVMQKGVITFEDLREGMTVTGKIKNVVDFGAFVDLGIKETALVHISELSDHFVRDPLETVKVGEVLEFRIIGLDQDRRRISLSRKKDRPLPASAPPASGAKDKGSPGTPETGQKRGAASKPAGPKPPAPGSSRPDFRASRGSDDGTMYNPFAEALKKMREKERR
ncbi:MAG: S1 RNA-binding domain-containing protein, partial [Spirochaetaceae bacterium]|nr:S1 RNA-binding domain-containing protein [Spirochaetaceae bacterium]